MAQTTSPDSLPASSTKTELTKATGTGPGPGPGPVPVPVPVTTGIKLAPAATSVDIALKTSLQGALHSPTVLALCSHDETVKLRCDAFDSKSGRGLGGFKMGAAQSAESIALSPDGSRLSITERLDLQETVVSVWSVPDGQELIARWKPYVYKPGDILNSHWYKIVWATFLTADRLLTLTSGGRVAVWSIPDGKSIYDVQAATPEAIQHFSRDNGTQEPANFSLSQDRRLLALHGWWAARKSLSQPDVLL